MIQDDNIDELKSSMLTSYFRHAIWIDNDIIDSSLADSVDVDFTIHFSIFSRIAEEFHSLGISCLLKNYPVPPSLDEFDTPVNIHGASCCKNLALHSDFVIIDWYLYNQDCTHCLQIINDLVESNRFHFIIILTNANLDEVSEGLPSFFKNIGEHRYYDKRGHFLIIESKRDYIGNQCTKHAKDLMADVQTCLKTTYSDMLHMLAFNFACQAREIFPLMIASIPNSTDLGLAVDYRTRFNLLKKKYVSEHNCEPSNVDEFQQQAAGEIFEMIASNFFDDIKQTYFACCNHDETQKAVVSFTESCINGTNLSDFNWDCLGDKKLSTHWNKLSQLPNFLLSHSKFVTFCENISICNQTDLENCSIVRGIVFAEESSRYICISQSCDCLRKPVLLFLRAEQQQEGYSNNDGPSIFIQINSVLYRILLQPSSIITITRNDFDKHKVSGILRRNIVDRLAAEFFSHITRVGVDISEPERILRHEK